MNEMSLKEQQSVALRILCQIDSICKANDFTYSLAYGTLLGAVRHGGFIPWDDDIDIMMPRTDFLKLIDYCKNNETEFELVSSITDPDFGYMFAKACDKNTIVRCDIIKWNKYGVQVDIFPIENLGEDIKTARNRFNKKRIQRELLVAWNWTNFQKNKRKSFLYNSVKFGFYVLSRFASNRRLLSSIEKYYEQFKGESGGYKGIVCGAYRSREIMSGDIYEDYVELQFESYTFRAIAKYHEYLEKIYGDYMQLPPLENRVTHHNFKTFWKEK